MSDLFSRVNASIGNGYFPSDVGSLMRDMAQEIDRLAWVLSELPDASVLNAALSDAGLLRNQFVDFQKDVSDRLSLHRKRLADDHDRLMALENPPLAVPPDPNKRPAWERVTIVRIANGWMVYQAFSPGSPPASGMDQVYAFDDFQGASDFIYDVLGEHK